jgi:hypothetical protein
MKKFLFLFAFACVVSGCGTKPFEDVVIKEPTLDPSITNFEECADAGYPVLESYPRQCGGFVENIDAATVLRVTSPSLDVPITSPLEVTGEARGTWFFEGSFPVFLTNWDGLIIAEGYATAQGEWMTEEFVPFTASLSFEKPEYGANGTLILKKDNPSGLPEYDDAVEFPVLFE